jgi:hypothetical protein
MDEDVDTTGEGGWQVAGAAGGPLVCGSTGPGVASLGGHASESLGRAMTVMRPRCCCVIVWGGKRVSESTMDEDGPDAFRCVVLLTCWPRVKWECDQGKGMEETCRIVER